MTSPKQDPSAAAKITSVPSGAAAVVAGPPARHRIAAFVFLFIYPLVTALLYVALPLMRGMPVWTVTLVVCPVVVLVMVYGIMPFITTRLRHLL